MYRITGVVLRERDLSVEFIYTPLVENASDITFTRPISELYEDRFEKLFLETPS